MTDPPPITQVGTTVLIQGEALPLMYRATLALIARRHRDGWPHRRCRDYRVRLPSDRLVCTQAPLIGADLRLRSIKWLTTA